MIIQNILSIFVLSLCLATLFITLVTYFLYRFKQLLKLNKRDATELTEGVFFKKYAPYLIIKESKKNNEFDNTLSDRKTLINFFGIMAGVIFISLISGYLYSHFRLGEKTIDLNKYEGLLAKGLMKEYYLNTLQSNPEFIEYISEEKFKILQAEFRLLDSTKIAIYKAKNSNEYDKKQNETFLKWKNLLEKYNLKFVTVKNFSDILEKNVNLIIIPNALSLNKKAKNELEILVEKKIPILATGPIAYYDGLGGVNQDLFAEKLFGIKIEKSLKKRPVYPTLFKGNSLPWIDVPAGLQLNYFPTENQFFTSMTSGSTSIFEGNTQSEIRESHSGNASLVRAVFKEIPARTVWLALDPPTGEEKVLASELYYLELMFIKSIQWALQIPTVFKPIWKNFAQAVIVPSLEITEENKYIKNYIDIFQEQKYPLTIFITSEMIPAHIKFIVDTDHVDIEFAVSGEDEKILQGNTLQFQFQEIQNSRLLLEENWQKKVVGFKPIEAKFDTTTLNAAMQNNLLYFLGNQTLFRLSPTKLNEDQFIYYPKSYDKETKMFKAAKFHNSSLIFSDLIKRFSAVEKLNGAALYNFPAKYYGSKNLENALANFAKETSKKAVWKTNYSNLSRWWMQREKIFISVIFENGKYKIIIKNENNFDLKSFNFFIANVNREKFRLLYGEKELQVLENDFNNYFNIDLISAKSSIILELQVKE